MIKSKKIALIGLLTALYAVLASVVPIPIYGNIKIDLGYIVLAISAFVVGPWAAFVGGVGCAFESMMFTSLGFSPSWFVANVMLGYGFGSVCKYANCKHDISYAIYAAFMVLVAMVCIKMPIECLLYHIPVGIKLPKALIAVIVDSISMWLGIFIYRCIPKNTLTYLLRDVE